MIDRKLLLRCLTLTTIVLMIVSALPAFAQGDNHRIRMTTPDTSEFPKITFNLIALDPDFAVISDLSGLVLREGGVQITEIFSETVMTGAEVIFVIDANTDIEERDEDGGPTRREIVRDSILRYVDLYMDPDYLDSVSIIVPDEQSGRFLEEPGIVFHNAVKNAVNFYMPDELGDTPLNNMLEMAIQQAEKGREEGRSAAIVLFSDSGRLNEQLEFEELVDQSLASEAVIYAAILGTTAETWEVDDIEKLTEPTGGSYVHMPDSEDADPLYDSIRERATANHVAYRSMLAASGEHIIMAELDGGAGEVAFDLVVAPPIISLAVDNSQPIVRVASDAQTPLEDVEPKIQPLGAEVTWPDGHPRDLAEVTLLVDGSPRSPRIPVLDASGLLTFDWDIQEFDSGVYALQVQVEDELGLSGISEPLPLTIEVDRPVFVPTATPVPTSTPEPTPVPIPTATPEPVPLIDLARDNALVLGSGAGILLLLLILIVVIGLIIRSRRKKRDAASSLSAEGGIPIVPPEGGFIGSDPAAGITPEFASLATGAYLEALENAPEHTSLLPLSGSNISLGRDPKAAQIYFNDASVSSLHARILESHGSYRIYDEGSTSGTYVNFQRIGLTPRVLVNRDEIHLGRVHLRFHLVSQPQDDGANPPRDAENRSDETLMN
jgi:hypothetical protein